MNVNILYTTLAALVLSSLFYGACSKEHLATDKTVCFESEIQPLIASKCNYSGCHNALDRPEGVDLSNYLAISRYVKPGDYKNSKLYEVLVRLSTPMPAPPYDPLTEDEVTLIARWIEQGGLETVNCADTSCDTTQVTLSGTVRPIFNIYCNNNACHGGSQPQGGINLTTYSGTKSVALSGQLVGSVEHLSGYRAMPEGGARLSDCDLLKIRQWVAEGALNN